jgi:hypothetical protein
MEPLSIYAPQNSYNTEFVTNGTVNRISLVGLEKIKLPVFWYNEQ